MSIVNNNLFELQQFALDNISEALFLIDEHANFKYVNKFASHLLGYTNEELTQMSIFDIDPIFSPDDWHESWQKNKVRGVSSFETKHQTKEGRIISVKISAHFFEYNDMQYSMSFAREISDIKQVKEEKNYLELQYRILFESASDGIFLHRIGERDGKTEFILHDLNQKACELWGYSREEIFSGKVDILTIGDAPYTFEEAMRRNTLAALGKPQLFEWQIKRKDGTYAWGEVNLRRIQLGTASFLFAIMRDTTERTIARLELEEAQAKLETVISTIPDLLWLKDNDGVYLACNQALEQFLDVQESEILGKTDYELMPKEGADLCKISDNEALTSATVVVSHESFINKKDATEGTIEIRKVPVSKSSGEVIGILGIGRDITKNKQAKELLQKKEQELRALADSSPGMMASFHMREDGSAYMPYVSPNIFDIFGLYPKEVMTDASPLMALNHPDDAARIEESIAESARTMTTWHEEFRINHPFKGVRWLQSNTKPELHPEGGVIWYGYLHDITEQKEQEKKLRENEQKFATFFNNSPVALAINDVETLFYIDANDNFLKDTGYTREDVIGKPVQIWNDLAERERFFKLIKKDGFVKEFEFCYQRKDGTTSYASVSAALTSINGKLCIISQSYDISERRNKAQLLEEIQVKLTSIFSAIPDMVWLKDMYGFYLACNPVFEKYCGKSESEVVGKTDYDFFTKEGADVCKQSDMNALASNGIFVTHEEFISPSDGTRGMLEVRKTPIYVNGKLLGVLGIGRDITKNKEQKEQLLAALEFNQSIIEAIPDLLFEITPDGVYIGAWTRNTHLLAEQKEFLIGKNLSDILPDNALKVAHKSMQEVERNGSSFENSYMLELPDGEHWFEIAMTKIESRGNYLASIRDITDRKEAENALKEKNIQYDQILDNSIDVIYLIEVTPEGRFIHKDINRAYVESVGVPKEAIVGRFVDELENEEFRDILLEKYSSCVKAGAKTDYINDYNLPAGIRTYHSTLSPIFDEEGRICQIAGVARDITESKKQEELLRQKEEGFRTLAENSPDAIVRYDIDLKRVYVNPAYARINNIAAAEALGKAPSTKSWVISGMVSTYENYLKSVIKSKKSDSLEFSFEDKNGEIRYIYQTAVPEFNSDGEVISILTFARDITENKKQEELLRQKEKEFRSLAENLPDNIARFDTEGRYLYINPTHERLLGMTLTEAIGTFIPDTHTEVKAAIAQAVATKEKVTIQQKVPGESGEMEIHDVTLAPEFGLNGEVVSVLGIGRDVTSLYRMQDEIEAQGEQLRTLVENLPDNIIRYDRECRATYVNPTVERVFGPESAAGILGKTPTEALNLHASLENYKQTVNNQQSINYQQTIEQVLSFGETAEIEMEIFPLQESASKQIHHIRIVAERDINGEICSVLTIGTDITEKKEQEEKLQKTKAKLAAVISTIPDLIWVKDENGIYMLCNPSFENFFGAECGDIIGKTDYDFLSKEQADFFRQKDKEAMDAGEMCINEEEIVFTHNGQRAILETRKIPVYHGTEFMGVLGIGRDITERKAIEEKLLEQNQFLDSLHNAIPVPVFYKDTETRYQGFNKAFEEFYGKKKEELIGKGVFDLYPREQAQIFFDADAELFRSGGTQIYETKLQDVRGINHDVMFHKAVYYDKAGKVAGQIGTILDITERKAKEEELLLQKFALNTINEAAFLIDENSMFHYVNEAACRDLGYSEEELLTMGVIHINPHVQKEWWREHWEDIKKLGTTLGETEHRRKDGTIFPIEVSSNYFEYNGKSYSLAVARDITERKRSDEMLRMLKHSIDVAQESLLIIDIDKPNEGNFLLVNNTAAEMLGYSKEELIGGMGVMDINPDFDFTMLQEHQKELQKVKSLTFETRHKSKNGRIFPVEVRSSYFEYENKKYILSLIIEITERKEMEEALKTSEQKFRTLIENATDNIIRYDKEARITYINPQIEKELHVSVESILGKTPDQDRTDGIFTQFEQELKKVIATGENALAYLTFPDTGNGEQYHYIQIVAERDIDGNIIGAIAFGRDVTELTNKTIELQKSLEFNEGVIAAIPDLLLEVAPDGTYVGVWAQNPEVLAAQREILLGNDFKEILPPDAVDTLLETMKEVDEKGCSLGNTFSLDLPDGKRWFELSVSKKKSSGNYIILSRDITERKETEERLKHSEQLLRSVFDATPDWIFIKDREHRYVLANKGYADALHISEEDFIGKNDLELGFPEELVKGSPEKGIRGFWADDRLVLDTKEMQVYNEDPATIDGEVHTFHTIKAPILDENGDAWGVLAFARDITERKHIEDELKESERRFRKNSNLLKAVLESSPDIITFALDTNYRYIAFNSKHADIMFALWGKEIAIGMNILDVISYDDREVAKKSFDRALGGEHFISEEVYGDSNFSRSYWEIFYAPIFSDSGEIIGLTCFNIDITERKQMQNALDKKRISLAEAQRVSHTGSWELDFETNELSWSDEVYRIFEIDKNEFKPSYEGFLQAIHPDDIDMVSHAFTESLEKQTYYEIEHRLLMRDGRIKHVLERGETKYSDDGKPLYTLGIVQDISERKVMEEKLALKEREFRTLAEHTPDTVARYDKECIRLYANPAFAKAAGVETQELLGKKPSSYNDTEQAMAYEEVIKQVFKSGKEGEIEYSWPDKNGQLITSYIRVVPEINERGEIHSVIATGRDISKLKEYEIRLKENEVRLKEAQKIAKIGSWVLEFPGLKLHWSDEVYRIFEIDSMDLEFSYNHLLDIVHPDERAHVDAHYRSSIENKTPYDLTYRILLENGKIKYIHERGKTTYDEQGNPIQAIGTVQDVTEHKLSQKKIEHMAHHDVLTGLPNRLLAKQRTEQAIEFAKKNNLKSALLFLDLDGFKTINDSMGHYMGDEVIKIVASRIQDAIGESDIISRQGGDEFLIFLSDIGTKQNVMAVIEKLLYKFEKAFGVNGYAVSTSASIGIALYPEHGDSFEMLLQNADAAMYKAKENGKNTYCFYTEQMNQNIAKQFRIQNDLKSAVNNSEFMLYYQPQVDLEQNRIVGVEALIRWSHPELGMVPPMDFIPVAESSGIIVQIGEWVIYEACRQAAFWHKQGIDVVVAVNISAVQFKRGNLEEVVKNALYSSGLNPHFLELELTESILINDVENVLKTVQVLKGLGVGLSIDDFGTGYSSLAYLKRFAVDKLKIDQSFIRGLLDNHEDATIVQTIVQMAKNFNLKTIAEGVENQKVLDVVNALGCNEVQGYHFAKPMKSNEFEEYFSKFI